jgi:chemotaxis protein histidine kinase CheA
MSAGDAQSELGSIDWREENASSLSEMLVSLSDGLKGDKGLLDEQIATSFLTGIVAATDRFSNNRTSSKVMTIAAQLMSAGANQQLIASKLEEAHEIGPDAPASTSSSEKSENSDGTVDMNEGESTKVNKKASKAAKKSAESDEPKKDDGSLMISHEKEGDVDEVAAATAAEEQEKATQAAQDELEKRTKEVREENQQDAAKTAEETLAKQLAGVAPGAAGGGATPSVADMQKDLAAANAEVDEASTQTPPTVQKPLSGAVAPDAWQNANREPSMGGTLNATTEQAAEDERRALEDDRNHTILSHNSGNSYVGSGAQPTFQSPLNAASQPEEDAPIVDPLSSSPADTTAPTAYAHSVQPPAETLEDIDKQNRAPHEEARAAIDAAFNSAPPAATAPSLPPVQPEAQPAPATAPAPSAGLPPLPPMPDFSTLPPLPPIADATPPAGAVSPEKLEDIFGAASAPTPTAPVQPQSNDPGQFKIPGQN